MDWHQLLAVVLLLFLISFCSCYYLLGILVPEGRRVSSFQIAGYGSDLQRAWIASRELLLNHRDPYSDEVTEKIQKAVYHDTMPNPQSPQDSDQERFGYPLYTSLVIAPVLKIPLAVLEPLAMLALAGLTVWSVLLWSQALGTSLHSASDMIWAGLLMASLPVVQGIAQQQLGLLSCFLLAASIYSVSINSLKTGGVLLALAMIKPNLALPVALWLTFWVCGDWRRRYPLAAAAAVPMIILMIAAQVLQPGWMREWLGVLEHYRWYTQSRSPIEMFAGSTLRAAIIAAGLWALVGWYCFRLRKSASGSPAFAAGLCLAITAGVVSSPNWLFHNQVILLPVGMWLLVWGKKFFSGAQRLLPLTCQFILIWYAATAGVIVYAYFAGVRTENQILMGLPFLSIFLAPPFFFVAALRSAIHISRRPALLLNGNGGPLA